MRWLAILAIFAYRLVVRPFLRRRCLFDESCSAYGIRMFRRQGFLSGVKSVHRRLADCRMPRSASFVIGSDGRATLLTACGHDGNPVPSRALELIARQAESAVARARR